MFDHVELEFKELNSITKNGSRVYETPDGTFPSITTVLGRKKGGNSLEISFFIKNKKTIPTKAKEVSAIIE